MIDIICSRTMGEKEAVRAPKTQEHLRQLEAIVQGGGNPPPISQLLGLRLIHVEVGRAIFEMDAAPQHRNPMGTLHGGILCDLADSAMGCSMATTLEDDESFTTVDLTVKFFKPIWNARLTARGHIIKRQRTLGLVECEITDDTGSLVCKGYSTCMVLRGEAAQGR